MYIVAMWFKYFLLPLCTPGDLVIVDRASYWQCALPPPAPTAFSSRPSHRTHRRTATRCALGPT